MFDWRSSVMRESVPLWLSSNEYLCENNYLNWYGFIMNKLKNTKVCPKQSMLLLATHKGDHFIIFPRNHHKMQVPLSCRDLWETDFHAYKTIFWLNEFPAIILIMEIVGVAKISKRRSRDLVVKLNEFKLINGVWRMALLKRKKKSRNENTKRKFIN